jgi:hypothetical protein
MVQSDERSLTDEDVEEIAARVVEILRDEMPPRVGFVDVATIARYLQVSPDYVREHAVDLGGVHLGEGPRSPWRFDIEHVRALMRVNVPPPPPPLASSPRAVASRRVPLLPLPAHARRDAR